MVNMPELSSTSFPFSAVASETRKPQQYSNRNSTGITKCLRGALVRLVGCIASTALKNRCISSCVKIYGTKLLWRFPASVLDGIYAG
jgi:hypothetical protein